MTIKIYMPNVNDGDAIIVHLKKSDEHQLIVLIDGGHGGDAKNITDILDPLLQSAGKTGPDLVICTHYDLDHIGGLKKIAAHYDENIGEVWIHKPNLLVETVNLASFLKGQQLLVENRDPEVDALKSAALATGAEKYMDVVLESYSDMTELVRYLEKINVKVKEPFPDLELSGWPEIKVLGPTLKFYNSKLDELKPKRILLTEMKNMATESANEQLKSLALEAKSTLTPCQILDNKDKSGVTAVNQVSAIIEITVGGKKYLFTGDANIDSFENIPDYKNALKNIYWLKVAHHGSNNNSNSELIGIMSPKLAYISGKKHFDPEVQGCLESKGAVVKVTSKNGNLEFP